MELKRHFLKSASCYIQKTENTAPVQTRGMSVFLILWFWGGLLHFGSSAQGSSQRSGKWAFSTSKQCPQRRNAQIREELAKEIVASALLL